ncbi:MAG TPA: serine hydrolase domain-containing protein [bacterium]|jgi:D-alanyl-D-alanine-carboxypeptidase/D-alanyl-D-alanine-endopeptidase|nr:serine hydrolase domain-containing protein [bacterium]
MKRLICRKIWLWGFLLGILGFPGPGLLKAQMTEAGNGGLTGPLTAQIQENGRVAIYENQRQVAYFIPQIFLKGWNIVFFSAPDKTQNCDSVARLPDGKEVSFKVSIKASALGLKVHCVMTPLQDVQVLSLREGIGFPYEDWEGDTYDCGPSRGKIPHDVVNDGGGIIAHAPGPLLLGPSHEGGLTVRLTSSKLSATLQDSRQWTPDLSVFYDNDISDIQAWDWKAGEKKTFDFTMAFNREVTVKPMTPPKDIETVRAQIDELVKPVIEGGWYPGMTVGLFYKGKTQVWGYGKTSLENGKTPDGDTEYEIGSITKLFTKLLFSDMVHQGRMGLEDKVQSYLPSGTRMPVKNGKEITLLMLSNHSSGLSHDPDDVNWSLPDPQGVYSLSRLFSYLSRCQLSSVPGEKFQYSNTGVALLGDLVSQKNDSTYEEYLHRRILDPIGLKDTGIAWTPDELSRAAQGYDGELTPLPLWKWQQPTFMPAGAIHSTVNDLLKLAQATLDKESSPLADIAFDETAQKLDWGPQVIHDGGTFGFNTSFFMDRDKKIVLVVLGNDGSDMVSQLAWRIRNLLDGKFSHVLYLPTITKLPVDQLKQYVGKYRVVKMPESWGPIPKADFNFFIKNGNLYGHSDALPRDVRIDPLTNGDFYVRQQNFDMSFTRDSRGGVTGYTGRYDPGYVVEKLDYKAPVVKSDDGIPPPP